MNLLERLLHRFGYVRLDLLKQEISAGDTLCKMIDQHRELFWEIAIHAPNLLSDCDWVPGWMSLTDDYLVSQYRLVYGELPPKPTQARPFSPHRIPRLRPPQFLSSMFEDREQVCIQPDETIEPSMLYVFISHHSSDAQANCFVLRVLNAIFMTLLLTSQPKTPRRVIEELKTRGKGLSLDKITGRVDLVYADGLDKLFNADSETYFNYINPYIESLTKSFPEPLETSKAA